MPRTRAEEGKKRVKRARDFWDDAQSLHMYLDDLIEEIGEWTETTTEWKPQDAAQLNEKNAALAKLCAIAAAIPDD